MKLLLQTAGSGQRGPGRKPGRRAGTALAAFGLVVPLFMVLVGMARPAWAAAGDLDPTFGTGGKVTTDFFGFTDDRGDRGQAIALQLDGKIVVAGDANSGGNYDHFALARYNPDGTLDSAFGVGGTVTTDFGGGGASGVAIQGDGKIVAAGLGYSPIEGFALARYSPDGTLDPTFGAGGKVTTGFLGGGASAVAIQGDGKIVAAGDAINGSTGDDFALARYNPDGTLDPTFGTGGKVTTDVAGNYDSANDVAIQGDGKIVAAGWNIYDFVLARYNPDGTLDATFGTGGSVTTDFAGDLGGAFAVAIQGDGKIVAAGQAIDGGSGYFALARYNVDGTLDSTFGTGGTVTTGFSANGNQDVGYALAIQAGGKIVVAGGGLDFALARYNPDGTLDSAFGTGGTVTTGFGQYDAALAVAIQGDGQIVAAGYDQVLYGEEENYDFALTRYDGTGAGPSITSVTPAAVGQGGTVVATIAGSNFLSGEAASVSGSGVSVASTTYVSPTKLKAHITVALDAPVGPRDLTVTDPGGSAGTCPACLVIDTGPTLTSMSPSTGARGTTEYVAIFGSGFQPGAHARFGPGVTVNSTRFLSSGQLKASVTIAGGAAPGSRAVGVVNPDGGQATCAGCFTVM